MVSERSKGNGMLKPTGCPGGVDKRRAINSTRNVSSKGAFLVFSDSKTLHAPDQVLQKLLSARSQREPREVQLNFPAIASPIVLSFALPRAEQVIPDMPS
jgi:hypothetical protein